MLTTSIRWRITGAKSGVGKLDGIENFGLWHRRVKDLLTQQGLLKVDSKLEKMEDLDWEELQERVAATIRLYLVDEVLYHVTKLASLGAVWKKLES